MAKKKNQQKIDLSVFFPAFNEEGNIEEVITSAIKVLKEVANRYEVIIVDDGSKDNTGKIADAWAKKDPHVRVIHHKPNKGYGAALRSGCLAARYEYVFYTDSDLQFDIREIKKLIPLIKNADIVSGYRIHRDDPKLRILAANIYNMIIRYYFGFKIIDVDSAFKLYRRKIFDTFTITCDHGVVDPEILIKANLNGFKIVQVGVHHYARNKGGSVFDANKFGLVKFSHVIRLLREMRRLKREIKQGKM
jgi:glycosyltransferase involved in cell wall biosynthesis